MLLKLQTGGQGMAAQGPQNLGDIADSCDLPIASIDNSGGNVTLVGKDMVQDLLLTGGSTPTQTLPTAEQICNALRGNLGTVVPPANSPFQTNVVVPMEWPANMGIIPPGSTFRRIFRNANSGTTTLAAAANSGVTISGTATIATSIWREYVVRIKASAPAATIAVTTVSGTKVLSDVAGADIRKIQPGMSVYGTLIGSAGNAKVTAVNYDTGNITVDTNSSANGSLQSAAFTPTVEFVNLRAGDV